VHGSGADRADQRRADGKVLVAPVLALPDFPHTLYPAEGNSRFLGFLHERAVLPHRSPPGQQSGRLPRFHMPCSREPGDLFATASRGPVVHIAELSPRLGRAEEPLLARHAPVVRVTSGPSCRYPREAARWPRDGQIIGFRQPHPRRLAAGQLAPSPSKRGEEKSRRPGCIFRLSSVLERQHVTLRHVVYVYDVCTCPDRPAGGPKAGASQSFGVFGRSGVRGLDVTRSYRVCNGFTITAGSPLSRTMSWTRLLRQLFRALVTPTMASWATWRISGPPACRRRSPERGTLLVCTTRSTHAAPLPWPPSCPRH